MNKKIFLLFLLSNFKFPNVKCEKARYDNYRVYEIFIENEDQLKLMREIENYPHGVRMKFKLFFLN